jgi:delta14-sterol reductase
MMVKDGRLVSCLFKAFCNNRSRFRFGGPIGALAMVIGLPAAVLFFATFCDATGFPSQNFWNISIENLRGWLSWENIRNNVNPWAFAWYNGFIIYLAVLSFSLPGNKVDGTKLRDGRVLQYKINGMSLRVLISFTIEK